VVCGRNSFWNEGATQLICNIGFDGFARFALQGGGEPQGSSHGTLFGVTLEQTFQTPGLGDSDRQLLVAIANSVVKPSYAVALIHTNLCGNQSILLQPGVRAVGWTITQLPSNDRVTSGLPPYHFHLGFVTPKVGPGFARSTRITFTPQLLELAEATTEVALTMTPGLCLNFTEYTIPFLNPA